MSKRAAVNRELCSTDARRVLPVRAIALIFGSSVAVTLAAVVGCDHQVTFEETQVQNASTAPSASNDPGNAPDASPTQRCDTLLASSLDMMHPDNLEISADANLAVDTLNNWVRDCGGTAPTDDPASKDPAFLKFLPESEKATATATLYDRRDVEHVRNCRMFKQAVQRIIKSARSDSDRIVELFELTNRLVALHGADEPDLPATLFDVTLVGKGNAEDRAWVFAELLRQAGYDAVIVSPRSKDNSAQGTVRKWLVGVPVGKKIYLFDTFLGWPIPSKEDKGITPTVRQVATLDEVLADDGLLRKLDVSADKPYPLHAEELKSPRVEVITESRYWLPRIKRLEMFLSGDRSALTYVPLGDVGSRPGLLSRVAAAGNGLWKKEDISVWEYPDRRSNAAHHLNPQQAEIRDLYHLPFEGPVKDEIDIKVMKVISKGTDHKEIKARVAHIQGDFPKAIRHYLLVQLEELQPAIPLPPEAIELLKAQGKELEGTPAAPGSQAGFCREFPGRRGCEVLDGRLPIGTANGTGNGSGKLRGVSAWLRLTWWILDCAVRCASQHCAGQGAAVCARGPIDQPTAPSVARQRPTASRLRAVRRPLAPRSRCSHTGSGREAKSGECTGNETGSR